MSRFLLAVTLAAILQASAPLARSQTLISHYEFDGNLLNAATFVDSDSQAAPDGAFREGTTVAGSSTGAASFGRGVDGTFGGALLLDGVDDWLDLTVHGRPSEAIPLTGTYGPGLVSGTVMAWVRVAAPLDQTPRWLLGNVNAQDAQTYRFGWNGEGLESTAGGADAGDSFAVVDSSANAAWADGQWHHIAAAWDGFADDGRVYVDGAPVGDAVSGTTLNAASAQSAWESVMALGALNNGGSLEGFWSGLVDDVRVYAPQLSNAQVLNIFNATVIAPDPDPADADFDGDGDADGADFLIWQRGVGVGETFAEGDASGDEIVDGGDLAIWKDVFGAPPIAPAAATPIPEPASIAMFGLGVLVFFSTQRARRTQRA